MATLQAIKYSPGKLQVLDQLQLPHAFQYDEVKTCEDAFDCIRSMRVRGRSFPPGITWPDMLTRAGAPAIAIVAILGLAVELQGSSFSTSHTPLCIRLTGFANRYSQRSLPQARSRSRAP